MSVPYTFGTNTYAQSGQLDANFAALNSGLSNIDASQITTGTLPVARGGTGATTAPAALTSLGAVAKAGDTMTGPLTTTALTTGGAINCGGIFTLPINNSIYLNGATSGTSGRIYIDNVNNQLHFALPVGASSLFNFENSSGSNVAYFDNLGDIIIQGSVAQKPGSTSWVNPSARDIKQEVKPYGKDNGLQAILALNPVTYRFSEDSGFNTEETHIGLVHDETAHMPEMHRKARISAGREVDALDCSAITFALVRAVQELAAKVEALEKGKG